MIRFEPGSVLTGRFLGYPFGPHWRRRDGKEYPGASHIGRMVVARGTMMMSRLKLRPTALRR
jgi:hypothetical protein